MSDVPGSRERILEVTIAMLDTEAESGLKIDSIVAAAHVGKQSIYHYFGDRDGLVIAAQAERYRRSVLTGIDLLMEGLLECVTEDDYAQLLLTVASAATRLGGDRRRLRIQALGSAATRPTLQAAIREAHRTSVAALAKVFAFGQRRGWVPNTYSASTLSALWFDLVTGHHVSENYADDEDHEAINSATVDVFAILLFGRTYPEFNSAEAIASVAEAMSGAAQYKPA